MMFKNLVFHRLPSNWELSAADFESQLAGRTLRPCGPFDMSSRGWVPVTSGGGGLPTGNQQHLVTLGVGEKLLAGAIWPPGAPGPRPRPAPEQTRPAGGTQQ